MPHDELASIGKYRILGQIGEGAMGVVYRALDPVLNRPVAVKVMSDALARDSDLRGRFLREAQSAGSLQHPNVVTIYDYGEVDGHLFIAMELVEGADLDEILKSAAPLSAAEKVDVLIDVLNGLAYAHKRGIVHRDIKPANVRIDEEGRARIMDFGIAHLSSSNMTRTGMTVGTPAYMSPEQITGGAIAASSDIFAVGAVMYELFTGEQAFGGDTLQSVMYKVVSAPTPEMKLDTGAPGVQSSAVSNALGAIVVRALEKEPADRYESALDMAAALSDVRARMVEGQAATGTTSLRASVARVMANTTESRIRRARRQRTIGVAVSGGAVAIVAVILATRSSSLSRHKEVAPPPVAPRPTQQALSSQPPAQRLPPAASAPIATPTPTKPSPHASPTQAAAPSSPKSAGAPLTSEELALLRELQTTALDARRRAVDAGATAVQLDSGDAHNRIANTLILDGRISEAGDHLNQATRLWSAAERAARTVDPPKAQVAAPPTQPSAQPQPQAPAPPPANPAADITAAVSAYARAIESRDLAAVRRAYPGITPTQAKGWEQFFPTLRSLRVTLAISGFDVNGATAVAKLDGSYDYVTESGKTEHQPVSFQAMFRRDGAVWQLVAVH